MTSENQEVQRFEVLHCLVYLLP